MNKAVRDLQPQDIWKNFADLNAVPRPSKKEEKVIKFMKEFGQRLGLETIEDEVGNVIIKKPATSGMEGRKTVVLQSHLDMVHQKNNDTVFDFDNQGIEMIVEGDWVKAKGTTLGADNGMGVASIMAFLESTSLPHPTIEALFTIYEETGMTGAKGLKGGLLKGQILLNLDTEEDDEIGVGCAGGIDITATRNYLAETTPARMIGYKIEIKGLQGGHSGMDIHKRLGNANKLMNRLLYNGYEKFGLRINEINGGGLRNAIPRESSAVIAIDESSKEDFESHMNSTVNDIKSELSTMEPDLQIDYTTIDDPNLVMDLSVQEDMIKSIYAAVNGVYRMSPDIPELVETSNNIAKVIVKEGTVTISCLTRSSVESSKKDLAQSLEAAFKLMDCSVEFSGEYPGWTPNVNSEILKIMESLYKELNDNNAPHVAACHAGLECGILGTNYPDLDMISFGPNIRGAHSPDERVQISSVIKFWEFLKETLKRIPEA
ncbi:MAG: aminoacyl-histidine dipeptidase [Bacteroidia bacterium]|nr:aminoacyl-histidine dipeptidase [Bacteroidia bacterium]